MITPSGHPALIGAADARRNERSRVSAGRAPQPPGDTLTECATFDGRAGGDHGMTPAPASSDAQGGSVRLEGGYAVIRIPLADVHGLRVALEPCPCRASKSTATTETRARLNAALGRLVAGGATE